MNILISIFNIYRGDELQYHMTFLINAIGDQTPASLNIFSRVESESRLEILILSTPSPSLDSVFMFQTSPSPSLDSGFIFWASPSQGIE